MKPTLRAHVRAEMAEYDKLCRRSGHSPTPEERDEAMKFVLLLAGAGTSTVCEAIVESHGHEDFKFFGGGGGHGGGHGEGVNIKQYVEYVFKRPRVMSLFKTEMRAEFSKLDLFAKEVSLRKKIAELEGNDLDVKLDYPKMTK